MIFINLDLDKETSSVNFAVYPDNSLGYLKKNLVKRWANKQIQFHFLVDCSINIK